LEVALVQKDIEQVGAFDDDDLNDLLGLDGQEEAALYVIAVGNRTS
jgi:hypothetical protein